MKNLPDKIQTLSNIAIIIVALLFGGILVKRYLFSSASPQPSPVVAENIKVGTKLPLADVDWSKSDKTLLLVLSTTCRYCTESSGFYQKLAQQKAGRNDVRLVAVLPQTVEEAQRYLTEHNVSVDEIKQASLDTINIRGTPTLIVVNNSGAVVQSWVGKLPSEKESEVVAHFFGERSGL